MAVSKPVLSNKVIWMRFVVVIIGFVLVTFPLLLLLINTRLLRFKWADKIPQYFHKTILKILAIHVTLEGEMRQDVPLIIVSNHISWLDIPVIGAMSPCYFIAKSEIEKWPVIGYLSRLQNTIFINRRARGAEISQQVKQISDTLNAHRPIILFPEGTTSDGNRILPFKSALLAAAKGDENCVPYVQTLCITYNKVQGMPVGRHQRPFIAWYGDMDIASHFKEFLGIGSINVTLSFGSAITYKDFETRQEMAKNLENGLRHNYVRDL